MGVSQALPLILMNAEVWEPHSFIRIKEFKYKVQMSGYLDVMATGWCEVPVPVLQTLSTYLVMKILHVNGKSQLVVARILTDLYHSSLHFLPRCFGNNSIDAFSFYLLLQELKWAEVSLSCEFKSSQGFYSWYWVVFLSLFSVLFFYS